MKLSSFFRWSFSILFLTIAVVAISSQGLAITSGTQWLIKKSSWTSSDEKNYSIFIEQLGSSGCNTVDRCLKSSANPYRSSDPSGAFFDADCGKFPYLLRGYFAWKNGLPFSYASGVRSADGRGGDIRYSPNGNEITSRRSLVESRDGRPVDGYRALKQMQNEVDTAMYRVNPSRDGVDRGVFSDFYMAHIDRDTIRAGSMIYDPAGHVVVVYKVETDGRVRYFDAHPDKTVSHGVYGQKFARSRPGSGAGFKNFRSLVLVGASQGTHGDLVGGSITSAPYSRTPGFSVEQFFGTELQSPSRDDDWRRARFVYHGNILRWYDFVRSRLAVGELRYHPIEELQNGMDSLCGDIRDRLTAVQTAIEAGIQNQQHPNHLPSNIYGTNGDWEEYSSPSRDARLKTSFKEIRDHIEEMVIMYKKGDNRVVYNGSDIAGDLLKAYNERAESCTITYQRTNGQPVNLDYDDVLSRLFALSFDPYSCVELRWGAASRAELASCPDGAEKISWYVAEQRLRNQLDRAYNVNMGFSVRDLQSAVPNSGVEQTPDVDLRKFLKSL